MLFTKYSNWQYEREIRAFLSLNDKDNGLYFKEFDHMLKPVVVIAGGRCPTPKGEIESALGPLANQVELIKARAGFTQFEIVQDQRGFK